MTINTEDIFLGICIALLSYITTLIISYFLPSFTINTLDFYAIQFLILMIYLIFIIGLKNLKKRWGNDIYI